MKVLGAGNLSNRIDECLQDQLAQDFIESFTINQENVQVFNDLSKRIPKANI